jgi:putative DNA primase/helicase
VGPEEYIGRGWYIFPLHSISRGRCTCTKGDKCTSPGKHPRTHNGVKDATVDRNTVRNWLLQWPDANWGVACGRLSGIVVIDIDQRKSGFESINTWESSRPDGPLPATLRAISGGGGQHLFFKYPGDGRTISNRVDWLPGVDVRSDGGYVVLPPGTHISGGRYTWINWDANVQPTEAPGDLVAALQASAGRSTQGTLPSTTDILAGIPEGQRDDTLYRAACRWRRQLQTKEDDGRAAVTSLILEAAAKAIPPFPEDEALRKVEQAYKQDHSDSTIDWALGQTQDADGNDLYHHTDLGNKMRFINRFGDVLRYVPQWGWLKWTDIGWQRTDGENVLRMVEEVPQIIIDEARSITDSTEQNRHVRWSFSSESAGSIAATERLARNDDRVLRGVEEFDADLTSIACRNGIVDLRTGDLRSFSHDDMTTKNTNVVYDPDFGVQAWENFLKKATGGDDEMVTYLQMAAGYTLTGLNSQECFFVISGPAASGKSTYVDAMLGAMGTYATTSQSDTFMYKRGGETPKDEIARLAGLRLVAVSEIREGASFNETLIKQITGGDRVTARFLYRDTFEFVPQFKLWVATNHDPSTQDAAMMRRIKRIEFPHSVPYGERDPALKAMLRDPEVGGRAVLAWAVRGAIKFLEKGILSQPARVTLAVHAYHVEQDLFSQFLAKCFNRVGEGQGVSISEAYQVYMAWARSSNERPVRRPQFVQRMRDRGIGKGIDDGGNEVFVGLQMRPMKLTGTGVTWDD